MEISATTEVTFHCNYQAGLKTVKEVKFHPQLEMVGCRNAAWYGKGKTWHQHVGSNVSRFPYSETNVVTMVLETSDILLVNKKLQVGM